MGEFDVRILTELFGGQEMADALTPEWSGGIYYAVQRKSAVTPEAKQSTASIGLVYYSKWKNEESARSFLRVYAGELPRKYSGLARREKEEADRDEQIYSTSEGDVLLTRTDKGVFISEGFPLDLARKLRESVVSIQSDAPMQIAGAPVNQAAPPALKLGDPGLSLVRLLSSAGVMKAAIGSAGAHTAGQYILVQQ
jgi:hypothetical protein